jgi:acyl carrier protein
VELSKADILRLLVDHKLFAGLADEPDDDSPIAWDSLSLTWFLTHVEQRYGLELDPEDIAPAELSSLRRIHAYLQGLVKDRP